MRTSEPKPYWANTLPMRAMPPSALRVFSPKELIPKLSVRARILAITLIPVIGFLANGARSCNVFTRMLLALFGEVPWRAVPVMPVEIMLLPSWSPFHISKVSYWSRTVLVPLLIGGGSADF